MMLHDISSDMLFMDGLTAVTLARRDGDSQSEIQAIRRAISVREAAASNGRYLTQDVRWHIPINQLTEGSPAPLPGDTITDADANVWTILAVDTATLTTRYACVCRNLAITENLSTTVTIQKVTYTKGVYGEQVPTWANVSGLVNVRAKIQLISGNRTDDQGRLEMAPIYRVWIMQPFAASTQHRVVGSDGKHYRVTAFANPEEIGALMQLTCELDTGV